MSDKHLAIKLVFLVVFFILAGVSTIIPPKVKWFRNHPTWMSIANAFSGGIFLGIGLLHMLPETVDTYNDLEEDDHEEEEEEEHHEEEEHDHDHGFNLVFFLVFMGYAATLLMEKVLFKVREHGHGHGHGEKQVSGIVDEEPVNVSHQNAIAHDGGDEVSKEQLETEKVDSMRVVEENKSNMADGENPYKKEAPDGGEDQLDTDGKLVKAESTKIHKIHEALTPVALMIALSVHSVFAGIAVGLEEDRKDLWALILAIGLHKG